MQCKAWLVAWHRFFGRYRANGEGSQGDVLHFRLISKWKGQRILGEVEGVRPRCSVAFRMTAKRYQEMVKKDPEAALDQFGAMLRLQEV